MMGAADGVETGFFDFSCPLLLSRREGRRADDAVVVMDAGAALLDRHAVEAQASHTVQRKDTDTGAHALLIRFFFAFAQLHFYVVQIRVLAVPELCIRYGNVLPQDLSLLSVDTEDNRVLCSFCPGLRVRDGGFQCHGMQAVCAVSHAGLHFHDRQCRIRFLRRDPDAVLLNHHIAADQKIHAAVNAAARVPSAVRRRIVRDDFDLVVGAEIQVFIDSCRKSAVAVKAHCGKISVDVHSGRLIDAAEVQQNFFSGPFSRRGKSLHVSIFPAGIEAGLCAAVSLRDRRLMNHGIMRKLHGLIGNAAARQPRHQGISAFVQFPSVVKTDFLHMYTPF